MTREATASKRKLQVVVQSSRMDGTMTREEADELRSHLVAEMLRAMEGPEGGPPGPELRFVKSGLVDPGWYLVTAVDEVTAEWLMGGWEPLTIGEVTLRPLRATDALWPERIGFWLRGRKPEIQKVQRMLSLQNRDIQVEGWRHVETAGNEKDGWYVAFLAGGESVRRLEGRGWVLFYEMTTISVRRCAWSTPGPATERGLQMPAEGDRATQE